MEINEYTQELKRTGFLKNNSLRVTEVTEVQDKNIRGKTAVTFVTT